MRPRPVPLVFFQAVPRIAASQQRNESIPPYLGHDGGGGNGETFPVAADDGLLRPGEIGDGQAVDQHQVGEKAKGGHGAAHGFLGGAENVEGVDFEMTDHPDSDGGLAPDRPGQNFSAKGPKSFGIIHPAKPSGAGTRDPGRGKDDRGRDHGTAERPATGFVDAGDQPQSRFEMPTLDLEIGQGLDDRRSRSLAALPFKARR
jgi:hypothetical protein